MLLKQISMLLCASFISCMTFAHSKINTNDTNNIIDAFLECDNQFFEKLAKYKKPFSKYVTLTTDNDVTYIPVESIKDTNRNKVMFKKPFKYHGLTITGYQNIYISTSSSGEFYYWGFIIDNNLEDAKKALNNVNWLQFNFEIYTANAKMLDLNSKPPVWQDNPHSIDMAFPRRKTIEKALYLETITEEQSRLTCSIQGDLNKEVLYATRPDIKSIEAKIKTEIDEKLKAIELLQVQQEQDNQPNELQTISENTSDLSEIGKKQEDEN
ncbi:hypothetical protein A9G36_09620 [Gilliamella sp. Choc6-1]|uniref:hypothetical protein n=1 Tax=unclassified Gilliamella TaxID=2685620 RepID=UPI00080E997B|nr:hypothetical protein [Gilliamella apicola]OCG32640.1 hypothetical protein A9G33_03390 [Gilliamella apicola]OCG53760.1 hypothetical protein A9G36_09620 [Gilliamella apicola]